MLCFSVCAGADPVTRNMGEICTTMSAISFKLCSFSWRSRGAGVKGGGVLHKRKNMTFQITGQPHSWEKYVTQKEIRKRKKNSDTYILHSLRQSQEKWVPGTNFLVIYVSKFYECKFDNLIEGLEMSAQHNNLQSDLFSFSYSLSNS